VRYARTFFLLNQACTKINEPACKNLPNSAFKGGQHTAAALSVVARTARKQKKQRRLLGLHGHLLDDLLLLDQERAENPVWRKQKL
jgi:hypothetical protein